MVWPVLPAEPLEPTPPAELPEPAFDVCDLPPQPTSSANASTDSKRGGFIGSRNRYSKSRAARRSGECARDSAWKWLKLRFEGPKLYVTMAARERWHRTRRALRQPNRARSRFDVTRVETILLWWYCSHMPRGNPAIKLAVTVDADVHAKVLDAAEAEGTSVSAWITAAARRALLVRDGLAAVAEWEAEHGAPDTRRARCRTRPHRGQLLGEERARR